MLMRSREPKSGKKLTIRRGLLTPSKVGYIRPKPGGSTWFQTSMSVWKTDEIIRRSVRDWKRLMGEDGHTGARAETFRADHDSAYTATHSVFPAPLVEWALLRYGGPPGNRVLDAFAGGPPRGVVSAMMGYDYTGFDLSQVQIKENVNLLNRLELKATYIEGDGTALVGAADGSFDVALTCPPYHTLERYSDLPNDLSNQRSYDEFRCGIWLSAEAQYRKLKPGGFALMAVGPFRGKSGELIDFPAHVTADFQDVGFLYWQQIVCVKNFGSAAKRASNAWKGQKLVPIHEFLLVFRKPEV